LGGLCATYGYLYGFCYGVMYGHTGFLYGFCYGVMYGHTGTLIAILSIIQEAPDTANDHHQLVQTDTYHLSIPLIAVGKAQ
jgi:hypothetical protein